MKIRFVINVNGSLKTVLGVSEQKNGDLNLHITSGGRDYCGNTLNSLVAINDESAFEDCDKHITVHTSPKSLSVNVVKRTQVFIDRKVDSCQVTTGINKTTYLFLYFFAFAEIYQEIVTLCQKHVWMSWYLSVSTTPIRDKLDLWFYVVGLKNLF